MAEPVLYRRYRPQNFDEVLGQDEIVRILKAAAAKPALHHAYLFTGSRGTGKTSVARILARAVGCQPVDLYEIDAASNRGVDEIRELREAVRSLPVASPYKVYIVDEAHMLTREAFNALLKTLEEPPAHIIFILATTEAHKLPETVSSRCQIFNFRRPSPETTAALLATVAKKEGYKLEPAGADLLGIIADGSFRDALGWLEKCLVLVRAGEKITLAVVEEVTEAPTPALVGRCLLALLDRQVDAALAVIKEATTLNREMKVLTRLLLRLTRLALLYRLTPPAQQTELEKELTPTDFAIVKQAGTHPAAARLVMILRRLLEAAEDTGRFYLPQLPLELAVVTICENEKEN